MIYEVRRTPFGPATRWSLEDGVLTEAGRKTRHWPLNKLRAVRIVRTPIRGGPDRRVLRLTFGARSLAIGSASLTGWSVTDQTRDFSAFARALCAQAASLAPGAQFEAGAGRLSGVFAAAAVILGVGLAVVLLAAFSARAPAIGVEIAARLGFVLILMLAVWPWLAALDRRGFDPRAVSADLLP